MKEILLGTAVFISTGSLAQDTVSTTNPLTFRGYIETYYTYDFNKPADNNRPGFIYSHCRHNEFNLNLGFIRASYSTGKVRGDLAIATGTYMNANYAAERGVLKNIYEAYAGYKLSRNKNWWFDIGIMPSHIGFESAHSPGCWTLTRSLGAENSPYFVSGAKLTYTTDDGKWLLSALALNGWQRIQRVEGNSLMSWGTQVYFKPSDKVTLNYSTFIGTDKPDSARLWRFFHDLYGIIRFTDKIGLIAGFDIGLEQKKRNSDGYYTWYTPVGILRYTPTDKWAIALRGEYYSDENGVIVSTGTTHGFKTLGVSVNVDRKMNDNFWWRTELRTLYSKDAIFQKQNELTRRNISVTTSLAISF
jgi:hypothetical protein